MGPNDAELSRVFTREVGGTIADISLSLTNDFEIVVEAEAGSAIHGGGTAYLVDVVVRDITANNDIPTAPADYKGNMGDANWPNQARQFVFKVSSADLAGKENNICKVTAYLKAGVADPDVSFAESYPFIITA